jgi:hypothetical protein
MSDKPKISTDEMAVLKKALTGDWSWTGDGDTGGAINPSRYYFCGPNDPYFAEVAELVRRGLMEAGREVGKYGYRYYHPTPEGAEAAGLAG